ncbi:hypothetical protein CC86DRAFT_387760 [Ophiobolus disseminans]|uniref:Uncharacterized protein n=1 Tax=Ophiobolus disseminans TaxID=1469910 RepID=A0A6A6ZG69_9PLEO|nr:hypothetical protein CC86DRAFT_387760 [Ophiobolus disseminans]
MTRNTSINDSRAPQYPSSSPLYDAAASSYEPHDLQRRAVDSFHQSRNMYRLVLGIDYWDSDEEDEDEDESDEEEEDEDKSESESESESEEKPEEKVQLSANFSDWNERPTDWMKVPYSM